MICPKCQSQINDGAKFCHICGAALIGDNAYNVDNEVTVSAVDNVSPSVQSAQPDYQPQQEYVQPDYQPQQEYVQQGYQPQQEYVQQGYQPQQNYGRQEIYRPGGTSSNADYAQRYEQFQNKNSQYVSPNSGMQPEYNNIGAPVNQKKSTNVIPIIAIIATALIVVVGIVIVVLFFFSSFNSSTKVISDFTTAVNTRDASVLAPDLFAETNETLTIGELTSLFNSMPAGHMIEHTVVDTETYGKSELQSSGYASALCMIYSSIGSTDNVEERAVHTVKFTESKAGSTDSMVLYFDVVKVKGQWKIAGINTSKAALNNR